MFLRAIVHLEVCLCPGARHASGILYKNVISHSNRGGVLKSLFLLCFLKDNNKTKQNRSRTEIQLFPITSVVSCLELFCDDYLNEIIPKCLERGLVDFVCWREDTIEILSTLFSSEEECEPGQWCIIDYLVNSASSVFQIFFFCLS